MKFCRSLVRALQLAAILSSGALGLVINRPETRQQRAEWLHQFARRMLHAMGVQWQVQGTFPEHGVVVSNHMGYLDVMAFAAERACVFVSKADLAAVPLIGWMTTMAGTVYVEPGRGGSAARAKADLQAATDAGLPVVLFPEGTTSDGAGVLEFRSGALAQLMEAGQSVTAAYVSYRFAKDNGPGVTTGKDLAFWGDDAKLFHHIFGLLALRGIEVDIRIARDSVQFSSEEIHRKQAAAEARAAVMELGGLQDSVTAG